MIHAIVSVRGDTLRALLLQVDDFGDVSRARAMASTSARLLSVRDNLQADRTRHDGASR